MKNKNNITFVEKSTTMRQSKQPNQQYIDNYDRETIKTLKLLEKELPSSFNLRSDYSSYDLLNRSTVDQDPAVANFFSKAISRATMREAAIQGVTEMHLREERLVKETPAPMNIYCNVCKREMLFDSHFFKSKLEEQILFVFSCPAGHKPKKVVYPNGQEYQVKETKCDCGGRFKHSSIRKDNILTMIDTCSSCGKEEFLELDSTEVMDLPIDEDDRKKYCLQFLCIPDFLHDLLLFQNVAHIFDKEGEENDINKKYEVDKIKKINVPALEVMLKKEVETEGYTKFEFTKTDLSKFIIVTFLVNDTLDRAHRESVKKLSKIISANLFPLNWRLISNSIEYRLGVLSGRIRAYETEIDLLELAKKIYEKNKAGKS
jgi:hypothetical protein